MSTSQEYAADGSICLNTCRGQQQFTIEHAYTPFTMAVVLRVRSIDGALSVVKLYDRRHASGARKSAKGEEPLPGQGPWDEDREKLYQGFVADPAHKGLDLDDSDNVGAFGDHPAEAVFEGWIAARMQEDWDSERRVYELIEVARAGQEEPFPAPRYIGTVEYDSAFGRVQGHMIEHISRAITLTQYLRGAGVCGWLFNDIARVSDMVMAALLQIDEKIPIINEDVRLGNILVQFSEDWTVRPESFSTKNHPDDISRDETAVLHQGACIERCFFIDFARVFFRRPDETYIEWSTIKNDKGEEPCLRNLILNFISDASEGECRYHSKGACRRPPAPQKAQWTYKLSDHWCPDLTPEEDHARDTVGGWGRYDYRDLWEGPHTVKTATEVVTPSVQEDSTSGANGGTVPSSTEPQGADNDGTLPCAHIDDNHSTDPQPDMGPLDSQPLEEARAIASKPSQPYIDPATDSPLDDQPFAEPPVTDEGDMEPARELTWPTTETAHLIAITAASYLRGMYSQRG